MVSNFPLHTDTSLQVTHDAKEKGPINPKGSNPQNPREKDPQNPNEITPQNQKQQTQNQRKHNNGNTDNPAPQKQIYVAKNSTPTIQVVADTSSIPHGSPVTFGTVSDPLPHGSPISLLAVGVVGGKVDGQEDVSGGLVGSQEKPIEPFSTSHSHPDTSKQTTTPDPETPIENPAPIACDPPDPVFVVCNLNTLGTRDFEADDYRQIISEDETEYESEEEPKDASEDAHAMQLRQTLGATNSQMSETHVKEITDRQGLSPRGTSHFSPGSGTGPPAARTRLKVKTRHPHV
ncbi:hypothetical protein HAX54_002383 [Datura stramonium]|uniref:Uncharacterized protein n=1 Tax=Datura stramonium TaxID=4076 RepID=A0ABS8WW47_DATST|nr:hypothetical protein [Datura stramonium]